MRRISQTIRLKENLMAPRVLLKFPEGWGWGWWVGGKVEAHEEEDQEEEEEEEKGEDE